VIELVLALALRAPSAGPCRIDRSDPSVTVRVCYRQPRAAKILEREIGRTWICPDSAYGRHDPVVGFSICVREVGPHADLPRRPGPSFEEGRHG
jgi:hypothetical protein